MSRYAEYSSAYESGMCRQEAQVLQQLEDLGIGFQGEVDLLDDLTATVMQFPKTSREIVQCSGTCDQLMPDFSAHHCHLDKQPFCAVCYPVHVETCEPCQDAKKRMQERIAG